MADSIEKLSAFGEQMKALHYENIQLTQLLLEREREITVLKQKTKELQKELDRYITPVSYTHLDVYKRQM